MGSHKEPVSEVGFARVRSALSAAPLRLGRRPRPWREGREQVCPAVQVLADRRGWWRRWWTADGGGVGRLGVDLGGRAGLSRALLGIWLYGFTGVRSARRLETAGREQLALQWLSG